MGTLPTALPMGQDPVDMYQYTLLAALASIVTYPRRAESEHEN
jgi:hypothetical protein